MAGRTVLVTGVPGVGKSTICRSLSDNPIVGSVVSMGDLIRESAKSSGVSGDVRINLSSTVTQSVISTAKQQYLAYLSALDEEHLVLLDSHTATIGSNSVRATLDPVNYVRRLNLIGIVVLTASSESIMDRRSADTGNPRHGSLSQVSQLEFVLATIAIQNAAWASVPVHLADVTGSLTDAVERFTRVLTELLNWNDSSTPED